MAKVCDVRRSLFKGCVRALRVAKSNPVIDDLSFLEDVIDFMQVSKLAFASWRMPAECTPKRKLYPTDCSKRITHSHRTERNSSVEQRCVLRVHANTMVGVDCTALTTKTSHPTPSHHQTKSIVNRTTLELGCNLTNSWFCKSSVSSCSWQPASTLVPNMNSLNRFV